VDRVRGYQTGYFGEGNESEGIHSSLGKGKKKEKKGIKGIIATFGGFV
jgi:hypothetical protein